MQTYTASTAQTPGTAALSRLSDFGSLETAARLEQDALENRAVEEDPADDDGEELDSLDDGLHAFQESSLYLEGPHCNQSESILPRHDGLGMFPLSGPSVQEQLWHFEQHNPRKRTATGHHRRRSSVQRRLDAVDDNDETSMERERFERIEKWRLEHSKILLEEVERQTRRRLSRASQSQPSSVHLTNQDIEAKSEERPRLQPASSGESAKSVSGLITEREPFWQRVTRKVIRDFIGLDDAILSIIFGEALPPETFKPTVGLSSSRSAPNLSQAFNNDKGWEKRLLDRLAREIGVLVQQLSDHPGAFSTQTTPQPLDYAGIPVPSLPQTSSLSLSPDNPPIPRSTSATSPIDPHFTPTLQQRQQPTTSAPSASSSSDNHHAALWGIEEEEPPTTSQPQTDLDYWERPPTLKTIFHLLHTRFISSRPSTPHHHPPKAKPTNNIATASTADSLRRAALIRQHHPLVSRAHNARARAENSLRLYSGNSHFSFGEKRRGDSSCASVSAKRRRSGSSRNYWDLGGSTSVGSLSLAGGGVGGWGEV